jgi:PAS domain S-box-containing protein
VDFIYVEVNDAFERLTGLKKENVVGKRVTEAIPGIKEANPELFDIYGRVAKTGKEEKLELFFRPLGIWLTISVYSPKKDYFAAVFENITEYKKALEEIKNAKKELEERVRKRTEEVSSERQRLYNVLETLPAYVVLLDKNYRVPFANKVFRERFGESNGRRCYDFLFNRNEPCENCETYKVLKTHGPLRWEWTGPDGRNYDIYDFPFLEADGSTLILEMGIDITDRKRLEKQLHDSERMAAIGQTAGMVGHDIRNPLQAITSDVYLLRSDLSLLPESEEKESMKESLDGIDQNVQYVNKIVQDLQDYSKAITPAAREIDVEVLCEDVLFKNGVPENIEASCQVEKKAKKIVTDPDLLKRILSNLASNAIQAMPEGGKLVLHAFQEGENIVMTVSDTGVGIPDEVKPKLFTPLFTTKSRGQGFGLAVVKRMTDALGATVIYESEFGKGTKFILRLPQKNEG